MKVRRRRALKEEGAPKRGMSAFLHFLSEKRNDMKKQLPTLGHKEIVSKLSEEWRSLDANLRKSFEAKAAIDRERYEKDKKEFLKKKLGVKESKRNDKKSVKEKYVVGKKRGRQNRPGTAKVTEGTAVI